MPIDDDLRDALVAKYFSDLIETGERDTDKNLDSFLDSIEPEELRESVNQNICERRDEERSRRDAGRRS